MSYLVWDVLVILLTCLQFLEAISGNEINLAACRGEIVWTFNQNVSKINALSEVIGFVKHYPYD